jgi:hypothetical protein
VRAVLTLRNGFAADNEDLTLDFLVDLAQSVDGLAPFHHRKLLDLVFDRIASFAMLLIIFVTGAARRPIRTA